MKYFLLISLITFRGIFRTDAPRLASYGTFLTLILYLIKLCSRRGGGGGAWKSSMLSYRHLWIYEVQIIITDPGGFLFCFRQMNVILSFTLSFVPFVECSIYLGGTFFSCARWRRIVKQVTTNDTVYGFCFT